MRRNRPGWLGWLVLVSCPGSQAACPTIALESIDPTAGYSYALREQNLDLRFTLYADGQQIEFAGPGGTHATEYVAPISEMRVDGAILCVEPTYRNSAPGDYQLARIDANDRWAKQLAMAARAWSDGSVERRREAIATYESIAANPTAPDDIRSEAFLSAVRGYFNRSEHMRVIAAADNSAHRDSVPSYQLDWLRGASELALSRHSEALGSLQTALDEVTAWEAESGQIASKDRAGILIDLAEAHISDGNLDYGAKLLQEALKLSAGDYRLLALAHNNIGYFFLRRADEHVGEKRQSMIQLSAKEHLIASNFALSSNDAYAQVMILSNVAALYRRLGDLQQTQRYYLDALDVLEGEDDPIGALYLYINIGSTALQLGDYPRAIRYLELAVGASESTAPGVTLLAACSLAMARYRSDRLETAIETIGNCARAAETQEDWPVAISSWLDLYEEYVIDGDVSRARELLGRAGKLLTQAPDPDLNAEYLSHLPMQLVNESKPEEAASALSSAILALQYVTAPDTRVEVRARIYRYFRRIGDHQASRVAGEALLNEIEEVYRSLDALQLGPAWSARTHDYFVEYVEFLLANGFITEAFEATERSRGISLRQYRSRPSEGSATQSARLTRLSELADAHAWAITSGSRNELPLSYYQQLDLLALDRLVSSAADHYVPALTLKEIQTHLRPDQLVLYYLLGNDASWVFLVTSTSLNAKPLGKSELLVRRLASARDVLADPLLRDTSDLLRDISIELIPEEGFEANVRELLIVPHRELHAFPFAALMGAKDGVRTEPVIQNRAIVTTPSLSLYVGGISRAETSYDSQLAVLADPVFSSSVADLDHGDRRTTEDYQSWLADLRRLPWTAKEAERISIQFADSDPKIHVGSDASREALFSEPVRESKVLHIATHGFFDSDNPENVGFALSPRDAEGNPEPGFITLPDLFSVPFENRLVVISGCDTAMGKSMSGEGMLGLSRGFLAQGVDHIISTLWPVSDRASATFMSHFYQALSESGSIVQALREAQNRLRAERRYRDAYFWAGYTLVSADQNALLEL